MKAGAFVKNYLVLLMVRQSVLLSNIVLKISSHRTMICSVEVLQSDERCRGYSDNDYVPHGRLQMPQTLLYQPHLCTLPTSIPESGFLQPVCGTGDGSDDGNGNVCKILPACRMYRNILCGFNAPTCM